MMRAIIPSTEILLSDDPVRQAIEAGVNNWNDLSDEAKNWSRTVCLDTCEVKFRLVKLNLDDEAVYVAGEMYNDHHDTGVTIRCVPISKFIGWGWIIDDDGQLKDIKFLSGSPKTVYLNVKIDLVLADEVDLDSAIKEMAIEVQLDENHGAVTHSELVDHEEAALDADVMLLKSPSLSSIVMGSSNG